jgi:hypothetical protein
VLTLLSIPGGAQTPAASDQPPNSSAGQKPADQKASAATDTDKKTSDQKPNAPSTEQKAAAPAPPTIGDAWSGLLKTAIPERPVDPTLTVTAPGVGPGKLDDLANHLFIETRTEYWRTQTNFSGQPTITGVINEPITGVFNPNGIPDPSVFQPSTNQMYSFTDWGTRGWLSDRLNTDFAFRYRQDLTHVDEGSPGLTIANTFPGNRVFELVTAYGEINGKSTDGFFSNSSVRFGRQDVYSAELATLDGVSFTHNRQKYSFTVFGGRRFSYFSDPDQRGIGGLNFTYHLTEKAAIDYESLIYVKASNRLGYHQRLGDQWLFNTYYKMVDGYPVDFSATGIWTPHDGKTTISANFFQKLTDKDFFYDYTVVARDLDPFNQELRLYLGPQFPYTQFTIDTHRQFNSHFRLGAMLAVHHLDDSNDQGPFAVSFQDYRANAQIFPGRRLEIFVEYHETDSNRKNPANPVAFDDISAAGSTRLQDVTGTLGRTFGEGRFTVRGGGFFRRLGFQDRFLVIKDAQDKGWLGNATLRVDQRTRLFFDYSLDTDLFVFRPSIQNGQSFRMGVNWKY